MSEIPELLPESNRHDRVLPTADLGLSGSRRYRSDATIKENVSAQSLHGFCMGLECRYRE